MYRAALDLVAGRDHQHVRALLIGEDGGLRQDGALFPAHRDLRTRERSRTQGGIGLQRDPHRPQAGLRIDDCAEQTHLSREGLGHAGELHRCILADFQLRQVLLGHLAAQLHLTALGQAKQRLAARRRRLAHFDGARENEAVGGGAHFGPRQPRLRFRQLRLRQPDLGRCGHGTRFAPLRVLSREGARGSDRHRTMVFGIGQLLLGARLFERGLQIGDLGLQHRHVETRQDLALLDMVAGLHVDRRDSPAVAFDADGHVIARSNGAGDLNGGGHHAHPDPRDRHAGNGREVHRLLGPESLSQANCQHAEHHDPDYRQQPARQARSEPDAPGRRIVQQHALPYSATRSITRSRAPSWPTS